MNREKLGKAIKWELLRNQITSGELEEKLGLPEGLIACIADGGNGYTFGQLALVCDYLGIKYGDGKVEFTGGETA